MPLSERRTAPFSAEYVCSQCGRTHFVTGTMTVVPQPIVFGGPGSATPWRLRLKCPERSEEGDEQLLLKPDGGAKVIAVSGAHVFHEPPAEAAVVAPGDPDAWLADELREWRKSSSQTMRAFSTSMLTTCTGGVAVYFAVLKFLGAEKVGAGWQWVAIIPAVLLVAAAVGFGWALRPSLAFIDIEDYAEFRRQALLRTHARISGALAAMLTAVALAIVIFGVILWK